MEKKRAAGRLAAGKNRGAAMLFVLCLMSLVMALGLSVLFAAARISGQAAARRRQQRCYEQARSFSEYLQGILTAGDESESFYLFVQEFLNDDEINYANDKVYDFPLEAGSSAYLQYYGKVTVSLEKSVILDAPGLADYMDKKLKVTVKVSQDEEEFIITSIFERRMTEDPEGDVKYSFLYKGMG